MNPQPHFLITLAVALAVAFALGFAVQRMGISPIVGYLLAGILVGPHTPGFVADQKFATDVAEIGVVLLMFGVGMHFSLKDLWQVRRIAIPGAIVQSAVTTVAGMLVCRLFGWGWSAGLVLGLAISVASTVVMSRALQDAGLLDTPHGHAAIGWTIVEDIFTVVVLVVLPVFAVETPTGQSTVVRALGATGWAMAKVGILAALVFVVGGRIVPWLMLQVAKTRSAELFTLAVLALALGFAAVSAYFFGVSLALGAFLGGIVVGQSRLNLQAAADILPMRDAFAVLFFVSVGMLFDPRFVLENPGLVAAILALVLLGKSIVAFLVVMVLRYSVRTAITVAICLSQVGEFTFILGEAAKALGIMPGEGYSALVAAALLSISLNPFLARSIEPLEYWLRRRPRLWSLLNRPSEEHAREISAPPQPQSTSHEALVVGYGPVGRTVTRILKDFGVTPIILKLNADTVANLVAAGERAIYGDASRREILEAAGIKKAKYLIVTVPELKGRIPIVATARLLSPEVRIIARARYINERAMLGELGTDAVCYEEAEAAVALAATMLTEMGAKPEAIAAEIGRVRAELAVSMNGPSSPQEPPNGIEP